MDSVGKSISDLQNKEPILFGEGKNTFEKDGKYFVIDREVNETEWNTFMNTYNAAQDLRTAELRRQLDGDLPN